MPAKDSKNTNFARAISDPTLITPKSENDGTEPTTTLQGSLWVAIDPAFPLAIPNPLPISVVAPLGQAAMAGSIPVVLASDQTSVPVDDDGGSLTVDSLQLPAALVGGRLSVTGPLFTTKTYYSSAAALLQGLIFTGACDIITLYGSKNSAADLRYLHLFDLLAIPGTGAIPKISIALSGVDTTFSIDYPIMPQGPRQFLNGIYFAISSTQATLTLAATGNVWVDGLIGS